MSLRSVQLPAIDRRVTLGAYVRAIQLAKANPGREFKCGLTTWWPTRGSDIVRQFRAGMHDRINQGIPYRLRGEWHPAAGQHGGDGRQR